jgi:hypothetical protein
MRSLGTASGEGTTPGGRFLRSSELGVRPQALVKAEKAGRLERVAPGVYLPAGVRRHALAEAAAWTLRQPAAVVALYTAAVFHGLTDAFERGTWLFVPKGASPPRSTTAAVHSMIVLPELLTGAAHDLGLQTIPVHGVDVRLTGPDRTVVDLWRYSRLVPREYALEALRRRVRMPGFRLALLARLARQLGVWGKMEPVVQGMTL